MSNGVGVEAETLGRDVQELRDPQQGTVADRHAAVEDAGHG
ncbi:hypothetical protein ACFVHB_37245 [Kitasatospora sp. NPDC127111]